MSNSKLPAHQTDALAKQLKDSLARRRLRPWKIVLGALFASTLILILFAWWLYPRTKPAPLQIIALDVICIPDETPRVRAQLLAPPDDAAPRRLSGQRVVFHEPSLGLPAGEEPRKIDVTSDDRGEASVDWRLPKAPLGEFLVLHIDDERRTASANELGRIFVWPKDAPVLIVDADETLIGAELDAQASDTLAKAAKEGWRIVYLSVASPQAHAFRTARGWIHENQAKLPIGPVLGPPHFSSESVGQARREVLQALHGQFTGKKLAIVKSAAAAQISTEVGWPTILIGNAAPAGVVQAATWGDVVVRLE